MEPRERSCLDRPLGLLFILAGAPVRLPPPHPPRRCSRFKDQLSLCHWFPLLRIPVVAVVELQGPIQNLCGSVGLPAPTLTPRCWNDNISCFVPAAAACQALNNFYEMGRLLGVRLNEGHLVCNHHSSQNFGGCCHIFGQKFSLCHCCEAVSKITIIGLLGTTFSPS